MSERPLSEKFVELHVYVIPSPLWQDKLRSAVNQVISETVSAGFIRISPDTDLKTIRNEIMKQLGPDTVPQNFIFCKSVGRCVTQVRCTQESELRAHHFLPPNSYCPELFLLDFDTASRSTPSLKDGSVNSISGNNQTNVMAFKDGVSGGLYGGGGGGQGASNGYSNANGQSYSGQDMNNNNNYSGNMGESDYLKSALADIEKAQGGKYGTGSNSGKINLNDYPNLTNEEIRMLEGMSDEEVRQYLINNGHMSAADGRAGNVDPQISIVIDSDVLYEDDGPQRGGMREGAGTGIDPDFDDAHMSEIEKYEHYMKLLEKFRSAKDENESRKDDLIKRAKQLYAKTANQKNIARDMWKKRYFEEKKKTSPLEDHLNKQRTDLEGIHRKILSSMENFVKEKKSRGDNQSSIDLSRMKIQAKKLEYEIEEVQRAVDEAKLKLTCEIKMTHQARAEVVALRADLVQKKINLSMARNQQLSSMGTQDIYRPTRQSLIK